MGLLSTTQSSSRITLMPEVSSGYSMRACGKLGVTPSARAPRTCLEPAPMPQSCQPPSRNKLRNPFILLRLGNSPGVPRAALFRVWPGKILPVSKGVPKNPLPKIRQINDPIGRVQPFQRMWVRKQITEAVIQPQSCRRELDEMRFPMRCSASPGLEVVPHAWR